ncbi:hypothetical protein BS78_02G218500 [Paspalum vaginatum]|nr:hypothetical protein BS78_02G218500 [Paspalum vaginatum]
MGVAPVDAIPAITGEGDVERGRRRGGRGRERKKARGGGEVSETLLLWSDHFDRRRRGFPLLVGAGRRVCLRHQPRRHVPRQSTPMRCWYKQSTSSKGSKKVVQ